MMSGDQNQGSGGGIRITRDEALSPRVDDMLQRQKSLLGEAQGRSDQGRRWYYQNWFVLMIAAGLAGLAGWAVLEPFFCDMPYLQGTISQLKLDARLAPEALGKEVGELKDPSRGSMRVGDQEVWLLKGTRLMKGGRVEDYLDPTTLKDGDTVGVYVEAEGFGREQIALVVFLDTDPPAATSRSQLSLQQILSRKRAAGLLFFSVVGGMIGLFIGAVDGIVCRLPRRAIVAGLVGLLVGFVGGFFSNIIANIAYAPLTHLAQKQSEGGGGLSSFGFGIQMVGRSLAWMLAGMTMGLGQGIALRSKRLVLYGFLGGIAGGIMGGLLFDPIDILLLGPDKPSAFWSRLIGLTTVGACVGAMIGLVELLARDAWLRMLEGPLSGKEFLIFKDRVNVGSSPRSDIYLFNDPLVAANHATIRTVGDQYELENVTNMHPALINGRRVERARLRHGDQITIGRTVFVFQQRQG